MSIPSGSYGGSATKERHITCAAHSHSRPGSKQRFENLKVRMYGNVGIVNRIVVSTNRTGRDVSRSGECSAEE